MKVEKIYESQDDSKEVIYQLENDYKIIRRSNDTIRKFNLNKWDEISFIPEGFQEISRDLTPEEEYELKNFLTKEDSSIWAGIKRWFSRFKRQKNK